MHSIVLPFADLDAVPVLLGQLRDARGAGVAHGAVSLACYQAARAVVARRQCHVRQSIYLPRGIIWHVAHKLR